MRVVGKVSNPNKAERRSCHSTPRANGSGEIVFVVVALKDACGPQADRPRSLLTPLNWNPASNSEAERGVWTWKEYLFSLIAGATLRIHLRLPFDLVLLVTSSETAITVETLCIQFASASQIPCIENPHTDDRKCNDGVVTTSGLECPDVRSNVVHRAHLPTVSFTKSSTLSMLSSLGRWTNLCWSTLKRKKSSQTSGPDD